MSITVGATDAHRHRGPAAAGAVLRGSVTVEPDPAKPAPRHRRVFSCSWIRPAVSPASASRSCEDPSAPIRTFEIPGIQPGEYFLRVQGLGSWAVKSIQWRGRDYTTTPFDAASADDLSGVIVTVTNALPTLTGTVRGQDGAVPDSGLVIVFPAQPALRVNTGLWSPRMTSAPMQSNGTFRITSLPAGDYIVAAIDRSRMTTWRDPEFLAIVERTGRARHARMGPDRRPRI